MLWTLAILAILTLPAAAYAHYRLPQHAEGRVALWLTRLFLLVLGLGLGWATSQRYFPLEPVSAQISLFLIGFGIAHVPAAAVLFLKHLRRKTA